MTKQTIRSTDMGKEKSDLELERLRLELAQLRCPTRSSLKTITWKDIVTILVAIIGILLAYWNGLFDVRQSRLHVTNERLRIERIQLEQGNKELEVTRNHIKQEQNRLERELELTKEILGQHEKELAALWKLKKEYKDVGIRIDVQLEEDVERIGYSVILSPFNWGSHLYLGSGDPKTEVRPHIRDILEITKDIHKLSSLNIHEIALTKEDITCIAKANVKKLYLSKDGLSDEIVEPIGNIENMTRLGLAGNKDIQHPRALYAIVNI